MTPPAKHLVWTLLALGMSASFTGCNLGKPIIYASKPLFVPLGRQLERELGAQHSRSKDRFSGEPRLHQIGANEFYYEQIERSPFTFTSHRVQRDGKPWKIKPSSMLTTGSSTPRFLWGVNGFGPFDFTKAAVIHDWLFEAHHRWCLAFHDRNVKLLKDLQEYADPELNQQLIAEKHPGASPYTLGIREAADVMAECIDWEMRQCERFVLRLSQELKEDARLPEGATTKMSAGERRGVEAMINDFSQVRHSHTTLAQYHWSIRSFIAKKMWNSGSEGGGHVGHASTDRTIALLDKRGLLASAVNDGYVSKDLVARVTQAKREAKVFHDLEIKVENLMQQQEARTGKVDLKTLGLEPLQSSGE